MGAVSIAQALQDVADRPAADDEVTLDMKVHELVSRELFLIANNPSSKVRGSMSRATRAQRLIMNRLVGLRRPGSHPAARTSDELEFVDLSAGALDD